MGPVRGWTLGGRWVRWEEEEREKNVNKYMYMFHFQPYICNSYMYILQTEQHEPKGKCCSIWRV